MPEGDAGDSLNCNDKVSQRVEPVILSEKIIEQARLWVAEGIRVWSTSEQIKPFGSANLTSPVDGVARKVDVMFCDRLKEKAKTVRLTLSDCGEFNQPRNTVVLNRCLLTPRDPLLPILLHEITHSVDPDFERDSEMLNPGGKPGAPLSSLKMYRLRSEQRAFPAMWTANLKDDLAHGRYRSAEESIALYRLLSVEFDAFWVHNPDLEEQTTEHFRQIVEALRSRE